jgi:hypothetical protein
MNKVFHILLVFCVGFTLISSSFGLFYKTDGQSFDFVNQYGDTVKIYGDGIYKNDSYFMAPIFKGTDCTMLFLAIPLLIMALIMDIKKNTLKTKLFAVSLVALFVYYSASYSFGVVYNVLHLVYIALFSCSMYALIIGFVLLKDYVIKPSEKIDTVGLKIFLFFCGLSLFVAWLPDIIVSLANKKSLELIEVYTTQITYVLDMGLLSPLMFVCLYSLSKKGNMGYILLGIILSMLIIVGVMVIVQAIFQIKAEIDLPIEVILTKVGSFVVLGIIAARYEVKLFRNIYQPKNGEIKE